MSLVGPRPEVPRYVACYPTDVREVVLSVRPGITDKASIEFKDENVILGRATDANQAYIDEVLPIKLSYYVDYVNTRTMAGDISLVLQTFRALIR
jgi:lipopolysaccharide/colanic/teichoic acid biosynthesis glycosyltransferase